VNSNEYLFGGLRAEDLAHVFMVPGGLIDGFYPVLTLTSGLTPIVATHEANAACVADGHARAARSLSNVVPRTSVVFCLRRGQGLATAPGTAKERAMLWTIAVILLVLWALGMVSSYTAGGLVHLLLVIAVIVIVFQFIGDRRSI
jgi:hypothetical protein